MLIEGVFDYAVVSGLVNLDQSSQAHLVVRCGIEVEYHHFFFFLLQALIAYLMHAKYVCIICTPKSISANKLHAK